MVPTPNPSESEGKYSSQQISIAAPNRPTPPRRNRSICAWGTRDRARGATARVRISRNTDRSSAMALRTRECCGWAVAGRFVTRAADGCMVLWLPGGTAGVPVGRARAPSGAATARAARRSRSPSPRCPSPRRLGRSLLHASVRGSQQSRNRTVSGRSLFAVAIKNRGAASGRGIYTISGREPRDAPRGRAANGATNQRLRHVTRRARKHARTGVVLSDSTAASPMWQCIHHPASEARLAMRIRGGGGQGIVGIDCAVPPERPKTMRRCAPLARSGRSEGIYAC